MVLYVISYFKHVNDVRRFVGNGFVSTNDIRNHQPVYLMMQKEER